MMKNTKFPPKNPPQRNRIVMETQTRGRKTSLFSPRSDVDSIGHKTRSLNKYRRELSAKSQSPCTRCEEGGEGECPAKGPGRFTTGSTDEFKEEEGDRLRAFPKVSAIPLRVPFALILIKPFLRTGFPW